MTKIKIDYLVPLLVSHNNIEYICFIDYSKDKVYYLNKIDENIKAEINNLILNEVNSSNLIDVKDTDITSNPRVSQIISDIDNDIIRKKFSKCTEENDNE